MLFYSRSKQRQLNSGIDIIDGLKLSKTIYAKSENRALTLLLKGIIVYLISAGLIGSVLTSTNTDYKELLTNSILLILSLFVSICYYNKILENIGNILYLIGLIIAGIFFGSYVNSGFYTWMNDVTGYASTYFNLPDIGGYTVRINNPTLTVTIAALYLGAIGVILINMTIAKKMHHFDLIIDTLIVMFFSLYLGREPKFIYVSMLAIGIITTYIWRESGQYLKLDNDSLFYQNKGQLSYTYNISSHSRIFVYICIIITIITISLDTLIPNDTYLRIRDKSSLKAASDDIVSNIFVSGIWSFFNRYENTGGMNSGRLGGVNSVRLDYSTDLYVTTAIYDNNPIYIRSFIGNDYIPYNNYWTAANKSYVNDNEFITLYKYGVNKGEYNATGIMLVENIAAANTAYMPYYTDVHDSVRVGNTTSIQYCPLIVNDEKLFDDKTQLSEEEYEYWTYVPEDNKEVIEDTINIIGIKKDMNINEITSAIYSYYINNIPYTLRPGATPRRKDFVNYFLSSSKKGYCAHFASAATLMYRELGIPARYVEGYVITHDTNYEQVNDAIYSKYYYGYKTNSEEIIAKFDVTDANAHAWVEVYVEGFGWIPVELTPPSSDTDSNVFYNNIMKLFRSDSFDLNNNDINSKDINLTGFLYILYGIIGLIIFIRLVICIINSVKKKNIYNHSTLNDKLIIVYHNYLMKSVKKDRLNTTFKNYDEAICTLFNGTKDKATIEEIVKILNKAGFSDKQITDSEFKYVIEQLK